MDEAEQQPADGRGARVRPAPDVGGNRGGDSRPKFMGARSDSVSPDDGGPAEGEGASLRTNTRSELAGRAGPRWLVQRERASLRRPEPAARRSAVLLADA